jgi:hypothetical protein
MRESTAKKLLNKYRQACFVVTDMDRDDPQDVVRWAEMAAKAHENLRRERDEARAALLEIFERVPMDVCWMLDHGPERARWMKAAGREGEKMPNKVISG